jgi:hypothetical protein
MSNGPRIPTKRLPGPLDEIPTIEAAPTGVPVQPDFQSALNELANDAVARGIEIGPVRYDDAEEEYKRIQRIIDRVNRVTNQPRTVTGDPQDPAGILPSQETIRPFVGQGASFPFNLIGAMVPQDILTPAEYEQQVQNFNELVIPSVYKATVDQILDDPNTPQAELDAYDQDYFVNFEMFKDGMIKSFGDRGQGFQVDPDTFDPKNPMGTSETLKTAGSILGTELLGYTYENIKENKPAVKEGLTGTLLRNLLIAESAITAGGQEILDFFGADSVDGNDPDGLNFGQRWSENLAGARGLEQLGGEIGETIGSTVAASAQWLEDTLGVSGLTGPDDTLLQDLQSPEAVQFVSDSLWWTGMGVSFALPIDGYAGITAKTGREAVSAGVKQARATKGVGGTGAQAARQGANAAANSVVGNFPLTARWAQNIDISDALDLDVNDMRVKEVSAQAANRSSVKLAEKLRNGDELTDADKAFLEEAGIDASNPQQVKELFDEGVSSAERFLNDYETIELNKVDPAGALPEDPLKGRADVEIEAGLSPATARLATRLEQPPKTDLRIVKDDLDVLPAELQGVRDRVKSYQGTTQNKKGKFEPETGKGDVFEDVARRESLDPDDFRQPEQRFKYTRSDAIVGDRFLDEMVAVRMRQRQARRAINSGKNPISKNGVLLTPRIVVPKKDVNKVLTAMRESAEGKELAKLIDAARANGSIDLAQFARTAIKLRELIPKLFENGSASKAVVNRLLARLDAIDNVAREIGDEATSYNAAVRGKQDEIAKGLGTLVDLMTEVKARQLLGPKVVDMSDIEKTYVKASNTVKGEPPTPGGTKPKLIERIQAARTVERINDLVKPPELRRSSFGKAIAVTADVLFPNPVFINKFITFPGIKRPPVYSAALKRLVDRMGNLNEEFTTKMRRRIAEVGKNPDEYASKLGIPVEEVKANRDLIAFGELVEQQFGSTTLFFKQYLMAGFGIRDDIATAGIRADGTVDMQPYVRGREIQETQTALDELIEFQPKDEQNILRELVEQTRGPQLNKFSPAFFEYLDGATKIIAGRSLDELAPRGAGPLDVMPVTELRERIGYPQRKFDFDPDKVGSNVAGLLIDKARVNLIRDFAADVLDTVPELFAAKGPIKDATKDLLNRGYTGGAIPVQSALRKHGLQPDDLNQIDNTMLITNFFYANLKPADLDRMLRAGLEDLISVKNGGDPTRVREIIDEVIGETLDPLANPLNSEKVHQGLVADLPIVARDATRTLDEFQDFIENFIVDSIKEQVADSNVVAISGRPRTTTGQRPMADVGRLKDIVADIVESDLYRNPTTNRIFENYYLGTQTKNVSAADAQKYVDQIIDNLEQAITKNLGEQFGARGRGTRPPSFLQAIDEDLPFYVFDTAADLKADVRKVLSDDRLLATYQTINSTRKAQPEGLGKAMVVPGEQVLPEPPASNLPRAQSRTPEVIAPEPIFPNGRFTKEELNVFLQRVKDLEPFIKLVDDDPATSRLLRIIVNGTSSGVGNLFGRWIPNVSKNGVLAGQLLFNPKYHMMNVLSVPAMVLSSVGARKAGQAIAPNSMSTQVLQRLYGFKATKVGNPSDVVTTPSGKTYDADQLADIVERNGINMSQATAEVRADIYKDFVRWTGENFGRFGREKTTVNFVREIGKQLERTFVGASGRTVWSELANATDNYFRLNVLIRSLQEGASEADAVRLAREAMYDYNNLTKFERDIIMKGIWIYAFRAQSYRRVLSNAINNPTRLLQSYKLVKGVNSEEDEPYRPFMSRYKNSKMFLGIYDDTDTRTRYALYGPDVPVIDAFDDIATATYNFGAMLKGVGTGDVRAVGAQVEKQGMSLLSQTSPVARIPLTLAGYELSFGEIRDASTYIPPAYIYFLKRSGNWEAFKVFYNVKARTPRSGKPTIDGFEWGIDRKDKAARRNWLLLKEGALLLGFQRNIREWSMIVEQVSPQEDVELSVKEAPGDLGILPTDIGSSTGALTVEEVPSRSKQELDILREVGYELY